MSKSNLRQVKADILDQCVESMKTALNSYRSLIADLQYLDLKAFAATQNACRAVIAHIQLLVRLSEWADGTSIMLDDDVMNQDLLALIKDADTFVDEHENDLKEYL